MKHAVALALVIMGAPSIVMAKDLRDRKPAIQQVSQRSQAEIEACLAERWVRTIDFPVGTVPMPKGIIYNVRSPVAAFAMSMEIRDEPQGRVVTAWIKTAPVTFVKVKDHIAKVRSCL